MAKPYFLIMLIKAAKHKHILYLIWTLVTERIKSHE